MAETKKKAFVNSQKISVEISSLTGSFVIPIIMTDIDAGVYLEAQREYYEEVKEKSKELDNKDQAPTHIVKYPTQVKFDFVKHLVKKVDFPSTDLQQFRNGERPFYKLMVLVNQATQSLIEDAFSDPNS